MIRHDMELTSHQFHVIYALLGSRSTPTVYKIGVLISAFGA
jgi:hypothetical protein